mmetsp:Transcript_107627/g.206944  ORF Transcript_107627/g.206944 Transcript_107627/m.206944 type:complete len:213 (+) Transcript_107627:846-1484(+)
MSELAASSHSVTASPSVLIICTLWTEVAVGRLSPARTLSAKVNEGLLGPLTVAMWHATCSNLAFISGACTAFAPQSVQTRCAPFCSSSCILLGEQLSHTTRMQRRQWCFGFRRRLPKAQPQAAQYDTMLLKLEASRGNISEIGSQSSAPPIESGSAKRLRCWFSTGELSVSAAGSPPDLEPNDVISARMPEGLGVTFSAQPSEQTHSSNSTS